MDRDDELTGETRPAPTDGTVGGAGRPPGAEAKADDPGKSPAPEGDSPEPDPELDAEALATFFRSAPPEVRAWIRGQVAASAKVPNGRSEADSSTSPVDVSDDDEDFAGLDDEELDDDDILQRPRRRAPRAAVAANGSAQYAPVPARRTSPLLTVALVLALIGGVWGAVWYAGRPAATEANASSTGQSATEANSASVEEQVADLTAAIEKDPQNIDARLSLGVLLFDQLKDYEAAKEQFEAVLAIDPEDVNALYNMGLYYRYTDPPDLDAGRAVWQKVLDVDPDSDIGQLVASHIDRVMAETEATDGQSGGAMDLGGDSMGESSAPAEGG